MKVGFTITIGFNVGEVPMHATMVEALLYEMTCLLDRLDVERYSSPYVSADGNYSQRGHWINAEGRRIIEQNGVWTGMIEESEVPALRRMLREVARVFRQDAVAMAIHAGAELLTPV